LTAQVLPLFLGRIKHVITIVLGWGFLMDAAIAIKDVLLEEFEAFTTAKQKNLTLDFADKKAKLAKAIIWQ
jgi:hypothetical protein